MITKGTQLEVDYMVTGDHDITKRQGYQIEETVTVDGTPTEASVRDGVWLAIEEAGDLPVYVEAKLTFSGHLWPWSKVVSRFDVKYQAVHMAEGTALVAIGALIWTLLPLVAEFIFILLSAFAVTYLVLEAKGVAEWLAEQGPAAAVGLGIGTVLVAGLVLFGGDRK